MRKFWPEIAAVGLVLALIGCSQSCASAGGPRHVATEGLNAGHTLLAAVQDTEMSVVCGRPTAPPAPACVPEELHKKTISPLLVQAFTYDGKVADLLLAVPEGKPTPLEVLTLLGKIGDLVTQILAQLPQSPQKAALLAKITPPSPLPSPR